jgi:SWI/SNF-related matrix-associated actin-dependent regulator of chromatin subfamily A-like protein 1
MPDAIEQVLKKLAAAGVRVDGELCAKKTSTKVKKSVLRGLREYQKEAVRFMVANAADGVLNAFDMGLGKSLCAIRSAKALRAPSIVVCPSFVRMVWRRELEKWRPKANLIELWGVKNICKKCKGKDEKIIDAGLLPPEIPPCPKCGGSGKRVDLSALSRRDVVLVHYDIVHGWAKELIEVAKAQPTTIVLDEIHYCQSDRSRRSAACRDVAAACRYRIGLSGTPMTSRPRDLWNPVDTLSPGRFGRPFDFYLAHAAAHQETISMRTGPKTVWDTTGASRLDELKERLSWFMIRRTKSEVELELPPCTRQIIELEVDKTHQRFDIGAYGGKRHDEVMREALAVAADGKLPKVLELVQSHLEQGSKVVIGCHRVVIAQALSASFVAEKIDSKWIAGPQPQHKREEIIDSQPSVLCCTMDSTKAGIDLTYANVAVVVELDWTPATLLQWEARFNRFGQKRNVLVQYLIALSTADEIIRDSVVLKLANFESAIGKTDDKLKVDLGGTQKTEAEHLANLATKLRRMFKGDG